jgi:tripartite ATP-independent transporter DctM subunit
MSASDRVAVAGAISGELAARLDRAFGLALEVSTALLVVAEIVILFVGIVARYAFHHPLIWSDELAALLFLWLAMLGTVLALRRGEHMRMTALVNTGSLGVRYFFDLLALAAALAFLGALLRPALDYAMNESIVSIMSLDISMSWRAAAMPVCVGLLALTVLLRILAQPRPATLLALIVVAAIIGAFALLHPTLLTLGRGNLIVFFLGVVAVTVFAGIPIAVSFGLATLGYLAFATHVPIAVLVARMDSGMSHPVLLSVPLFVFLGLLIEMTGMARTMVRFLASLLGHVRGGLSYVLVGAMYLVSGISGSKAADMAAVAPVLFPEMKKRGAKPGDLVALMSATGAQTETIPPSIVLINIGSVTGVSIAALFTGGLLPALVLGAALCVVVWRRYRHEDLSHVQRYSKREIAKLTIVALPAILLPFVIRTAVVEGVATATEVSTIGIVYAVLMGLLVYRQFPWRRLRPMLVETASLTGAIIFIIGCATAMAWGLTQSGFSQQLAKAMAAIPGGSYGFLAISIVAFVILGSVLEGIPAIGNSSGPNRPACTRCTMRWW